MTSSVQVGRGLCIGQAAVREPACGCCLLILWLPLEAKRLTRPRFVLISVGFFIAQKLLTSLFLATLAPRRDLFLAVT